MMTNLVYFFVITMTVVRCSACPVMCTCHNFSQQSDDFTTFYSNIRCGQLDVSPKHQSTQLCLEVSYLNGTEVRHLVDCFLISERKSVCQTHLRLIHSVIPDNITFTDSNCTEKLDLPENNITRLNQIEINLQNLRELDLSGNFIRVVNNKSFRKLTNLRLLNLSSNYISEIHTNSFSDLPNLIDLDLSHNYISSLNESLFHQPVYLQSLNLSHNNLNVLDEQALGNLIELQQLDVSFNKLVMVSSAIHLPTLTMLKLNENNNLGLSEETYLFFLTGGCLQEVDVSRIGLKQIPTSLTLTVRILLLKSNLIRTIRRGDFDSYPLLQNLDVSSNNLTNVEYDALGRLNYLTDLHLKNNCLDELPRSLPENLKTLNVENNRIQKLSGKDFEGLHNLEVLLLSGNNITTIAADVGNKLRALKTLDVSRNRILTIEIGCFEGSKMLRNLRLSHTEIKSSCQFAISSIFHVNNIVSLDLSGSPQLAQTVLADNISLSEFKELEVIDIRDSELSAIPKNIFFYLHKLRILRIEGNKLNCSSLLWLSSWIKQHQTQDNIEITHCLTPPNYTGIALLDYAAGLRYMKSVSHSRNSNNSKKKRVTSRNSKPKRKSTQKMEVSTTSVTVEEVTTEEFSSPNPEGNIISTEANLNMSSSIMHKVSKVNQQYQEGATTFDGNTSGWRSPSAYVDGKRNSSFHSASAILFEIFSISIIVLAVVLLVKCSKKKRYNVEANQQENELLHPSSVIELW